MCCCAFHLTPLVAVGKSASAIWMLLAVQFSQRHELKQLLAQPHTKICR
jgi:hypothetical protein